jgi:hypothetical protein
MNKIQLVKNRFLADLKRLPPSLVASKWLIDRTPYIFENNRNDYLQWKESLGEKLGIDSNALSIVGSAKLGFSLNPNKNYKNFDNDSDVDVAVISNHYFDLSWHFLRNIGTQLYTLEQLQKYSVQDHRQRLIYWGTIATDRILGILPFSKLWLKAVSEMATISPTFSRNINMRIYMDYESLKAYQVNNLVNLRDALLN